MRIILLFILFTKISVAQMSFSEANDLTYKYFSEKNYEKVISFGEKALKEGHNFLYLNYRLGIAHFKLGNYYKAEAYFLKVYKQNPKETGIEDYLATTYEALGKSNIAYLYKRKLVRNALIQMGIKSLNKPALGDNMYLQTYELTLNPIKRNLMTFNYSNINQNLYWGNYQQNQLFWGNQWTVNKNLNFNANFHYINLRGVSSFNNQNPQETNSNTVLTSEGELNIETTNSSSQVTTGTLNQNNYLLNLNVKFKNNNLDWCLGFNALFDDNKDAFSEKETQTINIKAENNLGETIEDITSITTTDSSFGNPSINFYQLDISASREYGLLRPKTILKGGVSVPFTSQTIGVNLNGSVFQKFTPKSWLGLSLVKNQNLNGILQDGKIINNGLDLTNHQIGMHWQYYPNAKWTFELDFQRETKTEFFTLERYNYNTLLGTIKYNF